MLHKTRGIVLSYLKYKETSVIARVYTESFGIQSYIINGLRSSKSKKGLALLQPLTVLDMVVYFKESKQDSLNRISEYKPLINFRSIPFDIKKSTMALFITELLTKVLKEEEHHGEMFEYLHQFILYLDELETGFESHHLLLMIQLLPFLGFAIQRSETLSIGNHVDDQVIQNVLTLADSSLHGVPVLTNEARRNILKFLIDYYTLHIEGFEQMNSLPVLAQIFK